MYPSSFPPDRARALSVRMMACRSWLSITLTAALAGLAVVAPASAQRLGFRLYDQDNGLSSATVLSLAQERAGFLYAGTETGLYCFAVIDVLRGPGRFANDSGQLDLVEDGAGHVVTQNAQGLLMHKYGRWIAYGRIEGLLAPEGRFVIASLHPVVTGISVGDREISRAQIQGGVLHLHGSGDPLVIGFASLDFRFEKSIRFRYRLLGVDRRWVETSAHEVRYPDPPWGRLVFEVMAVDPLHQNSTPVSLTIKVRPPWWRSWPALAAGILLVLGALGLLLRLRVSYLLVRQRQLEALVAERTREIEQARMILFKQAHFDSLTGLLSRAAVLEKLRVAMERAVLDDTPLAVALLDLDCFKKINDGFGHLGGDAVLSEVGRRLSASIRDEDQIGRYGGEELLLLLPGLRQDAQERIEAMREAVFAQPIPFEDSMIPVTSSIGVTWMRTGDDVTSMIRRADAALYTAKRNGRNNVVFDPPAPWPTGSGRPA